MSWYLKALSSYATFSGRSRRREYWLFALFNVIVIIGLMVVDGLIGTLAADGSIGLLSGIYVLGVIIPSIAVGVRRLHDIGRSGWWLLINLIPVIGGLVIFIFSILDSQPETNKYGPSPKYAS
jgi:uncharacterized membrane protein YhaH (DUF805 family)